MSFPSPTGNPVKNTLSNALLFPWTSVPFVRERKSLSTSYHPKGSLTTRCDKRSKEEQHVYDKSQAYSEECQRTKKKKAEDFNFQILSCRGRQPTIENVENKVTIYLESVDLSWPISNAIGHNKYNFYITKTLTSLHAVDFFLTESSHKITILSLTITCSIGLDPAINNATYFTNIAVPPVESPPLILSSVQQKTGLLSSFSSVVSASLPASSFPQFNKPVTQWIPVHFPSSNILSLFKIPRSTLQTPKMRLPAKNPSEQASEDDLELPGSHHDSGRDVSTHPNVSPSQDRLPYSSSDIRISSVSEVPLSGPLLPSFATVHRYGSSQKRKKKTKSSVSDIPKHLLTDMGSIRDAVSHPGAVPKPVVPESQKFPFPFFSNLVELSARLTTQAAETSSVPSSSISKQAESHLVIPKTGEAIIKELCLYCAPIAAVPGVLTLTVNAITFEPDPRSQFVKDYGIGQFQVYIDLNDVIACAAVMLPDGPLLTQYLGFHHDSSNKYDITCGAFSSASMLVGQLPSQSEIPVPSFFQIVVKTLNGRARPKKQRKGFSSLLKRDSGSQTLGIRKSPSRHQSIVSTSSITASQLESVESLPDFATDDSNQLKVANESFLSLRRHRSIGVARELFSQFRGSRPPENKVDDRGATYSGSELDKNTVESITGSLGKDRCDSAPSQLSKIKRLPSLRNQLTSVAQLSLPSREKELSSLETVTDSATLERARHPGAIECPSLLAQHSEPGRSSSHSPSSNMSPSSTSRTQRLFSSLSSWTKRRKPRTSTLDGPLLFSRVGQENTESPLPQSSPIPTRQPSPSNSPGSTYGSKESSKRRFGLSKWRQMETSTSNALSELEEKLDQPTEKRAMRKNQSISFPVAELEEENEVESDPEPPKQITDSVLFRFTDHSIVRGLTHKTMTFIDRRDLLRQQSIQPSLLLPSKDNGNLAERRYSATDQPIPASKLPTASSWGTVPAVPLTLTAIPYSSNSVFEAFLLSPRTQQGILEAAESQLLASGVTPNRLEIFSRALLLSPQLSVISSLSKLSPSKQNQELLENVTTDKSPKSPTLKSLKSLGPGYGNQQISKEFGETSTISAVSGTSIFWAPVVEGLEGSPLLMTSHVATELASYVPYTLGVRNWKLTFCTKIHGISFQTFYRLLYNMGPCILLICDTKGVLFGAFVSTSIREASHYYATGETFVFTFKKYSKSKYLITSLGPKNVKTQESLSDQEPLREIQYNSQPPIVTEQISVYPWSSKNNLFVFSDSKSIAVGGGGSYAITIDSSFLRGSSSPCTTFNNPCLASGPDFLVRYFQVWCFKDPL